LALFGSRKDWRPWIAFLAPIAALVLIIYVLPFVGTGAKSGNGHYLIGISYLAFRSSHLVLEVRNGAVPAPNIFRYFSFCFFSPTMTLGPINPYSNFCRGFDSNCRPELPIGRSTLRIIVGLVKFIFIGSYFNQLSFSGLLLDDHYHHWIDLPIACFSYFLYLYFNFSGYCDVVIGIAGLIGIPVAENFANPLLARNIKIFWNRWHITLSSYMRDVVFSPLSKALTRILGPSNTNHAVAITIGVVFVLIGIWHGVGWNFVAYGIAHAAAVVTNHYYTIFLKKRLGRDGFKAYNENPVIHALAVALTFCFCSSTLFMFANTFPEMAEIIKSLR
jgi:D-alanyl-lipoteichoic acid acyltransferase DltB (MBOAT superfamily)